MPHSRGHPWVSEKLINQYTGPCKTVSKHYLSDSSLAPNVFGLEHVCTGRKLLGVNIRRLYRTRPGTEFLLQDFNQSTPQVEVSSASNCAPVRMIDDFMSDGMIAVEHPTQPEEFAVGKVIHVGFETNELSIPYWGSASKYPLAAALQPEYFDP